MEDDVHTEFERALVKRGGEGGIHERQDVVAVGDFFDFEQVEDVEIGIGGRFGEDEAGVFLYCFFEDLIVAERHDGAFDCELL